MPSVEQLNLFRTRFYQVHGHTHGPERSGTYWVIPTLPVSGPRLPMRMYWLQNSGWHEIDDNGRIVIDHSQRALAMWIEETPEEKRKATSHGGNHIA
jgi:hypothetical protein